MLNIGIGRQIERVFPGSIQTLAKITGYLSKSGRDRRVATKHAQTAEAAAAADDAEIMSRAEAILAEAISLGRDGNFTIVPSVFPVSATDNCNLACIMCPGHTGMKGPALTFEQAEGIFASLNSNRASFGKPVYLDVTAGEATLNRDLHRVFKSFRERFPEATISVITNATLPLRGRVTEIFEHATAVAISIDGATKESYERIRRGSRFENVIRNAKDICALKDGNVQVIFVAMDQNIAEMAAMVRLCSEIGAKQLIIQGVEQGSSPFLREGDSMAFDAPAELLKKYLVEAQLEADRLGIMFSPTPGVRDKANTSPISTVEKRDPIEARKAWLQGVKMCHVPWTIAPRMNHTGDKLTPTRACCHMPGNKIGIGGFREEFADMPVGELYNSQRYWDIRQGLLDGSISRDACKGCQYADSYQWTAAQLREIEAGIEQAKSMGTEAA
ncbi:radical SAM/SPASM domain-containing protein [Rhizobium metallidurans]|uniref:MoaA/NifB/PqqE/SkfB family radical SAM enzyme n=1 Tax=Rhizobium metallidurans TaxID=1265931 RepID=A0A7W6GBQ8_9HYPH|nr:radical SAM/SPASM domain-containing protein [Rhizobium metallidurans]MBB3965963.1 MoaA/NifB/PqqE/SkfB family radical SAM enzyme [Rhizobium metallidurans]